MPARATVVGAGFAGVEAAWALTRAEVAVRLIEMRPAVWTPAHATEWFAELVCSNSFKSKLPTSPAGRLKEEMAALGSLVLDVASRNEVPGGEALCVDREAFGKEITARIESEPLISIERREFLPEDLEAALESEEPVILATGPLTSPALSDWLAQITGRQHLYFYDAVSPTVEAASLDRSVVFAQSRYGKGAGDDYLNCPFDRESYLAFVRELHVYGSETAVDTGPTSYQHRGVGRALMGAAESLAFSSHQVPELQVVSGVGVRNYYRKLGYELNVGVMVKRSPAKKTGAERPPREPGFQVRGTLPYAGV